MAEDREYINSVKRYLKKIKKSKVEFDKAFADYVGKIEYESFKGSRLEQVRKEEFADYLMYLAGTIE